MDSKWVDGSISLDLNMDVLPLSKENGEESLQSNSMDLGMKISPKDEVGG